MRKVALLVPVVVCVSACTPTNTSPVTATRSWSPGGTTSSTVSSATPQESTPWSGPSPTETPTSEPPSVPPVRRTVLSALATLPLKGRAPKTGYARDQFGQAWADVDRNGCDTRNDILRRDLEHYFLEAGTHGCLVLKGTLHDPYTGTTISFVRGTSTSPQVQIDHVVALADAWQKGAQQLTGGTREELANDPLNLLAVSGPTNQAKSDGDAATWLPPNTTFRCAYVARQVAVKAKYHLWVTTPEKTAIAAVLEKCPSQTLPTSTTIPLGGGTILAPTSPPPSPQAPSPSTLDPRFDTCTAAKAAGYGPYFSGTDPEYDWYHDTDGDGVACE